MSDHSAFQLTIYTCPPQYHAAVVDVLNQYGVGREWGGSGGVTELNLGEEYVDSEARTDLPEDIAERLMALPDIVFCCWNDPKYEYLGTYCVYTPDLGLFTGECDAIGNVIISAPLLAKMVADATSLEQLKADVDAALAGPWERAVEQYRTEDVRS